MEVHLLLKTIVCCFVISAIWTKPLTDHFNLNPEHLLLRMNLIEKKFKALETHQHLFSEILNKTDPVSAPGPSDVYFTAELAADVKGLVKWEKVVYGNAYSHAGGGYDTHTGIFTAPTSGVYLFSLFCNSLTAQTVTLEMTRDGLSVGSCIVEPSYDGEDEIGGTTYANRLSIGDKMWVQIYYSDRNSVDLKGNVNTFAGVLIHR